jgi:hypothetical protein
VRVNPSHIQAYRNMAAQVRPVTPEQQRVDRASVQATGKRKAVEIEGSEFINYLSKAEKNFLVERFTAAEHPSTRSNGGFGDKTRGTYLDLKA